MRKVIQKFNVYRFSELSDDAKEKAKQWYQGCGDAYIWGDDALESIKALAKHFGGKLKSYEIDWFDSVPCSPPKFEMPEMEREEIEELLGQLGSYDHKTLRGHGDCKLTSFCADEDAIDGFRKAFMGGESDLGELMDAAFDSWLKAAVADCRDFYEDERFSEHCDTSGYEFTEDGEFYI